MLGVLSASASAVLFKLAQAEPLVVAFYRLLFSTLILALPLLWTGWQRIGRRDLLLSLLSGTVLAAHFATWFFSLTLTSIASSTVLVTAHPFLVLLYGYLAWGERTNRLAVAGVVVAVGGAVLIGWGDFGLDARALLGDLLAFLGAVAVAGYFIIGRIVRQRVGAMQYSAIAFGSASLVLLAGALALGNPLTGFSTNTWAAFLALAVFPTIFGHTLFNWALKHVPPSVLSVSILGEPMGATLLAWLLWRELPGAISLAGGAVVLSGIGLFIWANRKRAA